MMFVSISTLVYMLGVATAGWLAWSAYCWFDKRREARRKMANFWGFKCAEYGAKRFANFLGCYGAGDYSGLWAEHNYVMKAQAEGKDVLKEEFEAIAAGIMAEKAAVVTA
jgi:hypothetical protein